MSADNEFAEARIAIQSNGCWHWTGVVNARGYGTAKRPGVWAKNAHRFVWEIFVGPIGDGLTLDHVCHNSDPSCAGGTACQHRRCVNPDHLEPVSPAENTRRGNTPTALNLRKTRCLRGHEYDGIDSRNGWRTCSACRRLLYAKKRAA